jgi:hypothetical protein
MVEAIVSWGRRLRSEGNQAMSVSSQVLTIAEVALDLRCSKAHVYNAINGRVAAVSPLPAISMGRRKLVLRDSLENWKRKNQHSASDDGMLLESPEVDTGRRA